MSKDINEKAQQDASNGNYNPPESVNPFWSSSEKVEQNEKDKLDYDKSYEVTKAQQDESKGDYTPPPNPSTIFDSDYDFNRKIEIREAYDKSWNDSFEQ